MSRIIFENIIESNPESENYGKPVYIELPDEITLSYIERLGRTITKARENNNKSKRISRKTI